MTLTDLLVPTYTQMLRALSGWLDKAHKQLPKAEAEALLSARLAPDMFPLSTQIRFACLQAREASFRLRGEPLPEALEQLSREASNAGEQPGSIADAQARIADANALDAGAQRTVTLALPNGIIFDMTGAQYARDWALPQFYFHLTTAYAILRSRNIELGKADYVAHMLGYLRPGSAPQG
ncbi:MAG: DUF1993 domain-containing protein [Alphaproteobacteria bacterium]|nr:DUF1993 domain-containing protein [Alphaproteobacteria bacterium]